MTLQTWAAAGVILGVVLTALTLAAVIGRPLRRLARQNDEFREDWYGVPARPGRAAVPGVPERLALIEKELKPNSGSTLRDAIGRVETRLEDHIRSHGGA
ncbi:hypothetical protein O7630_34695 [Micromonospora sp. WMMD718]|uniref:hypothetical protein n=1 Tax=Micromonospora TaxID=1873 RepID=UPI000A93357C|nr:MULTISPECIES: hypothetical protein [Micromonospora]MCT2277983.1 hypothetical protein [Micromonospora chalcea]MDG4756041.1 hypothetical protein [Micromonospora sp. WMMD718]MDG4756095.1 hypothetical protein [Micromonospora sp. WMMD718]